MTIDHIKIHYFAGVHISRMGAKTEIEIESEEGIFGQDLEGEIRERYGIIGAEIPPLEYDPDETNNRIRY